ncbi:hypothetical protein TELCIR_08582 [Teladorsagia circumcincta]|uniref:Uncharacterized protein n=1 Tax=Teladorsagia circumcincta TaxID=45464 RepID=A0A2G9UH55_TELCI|nr:hypothetical protein TELCIR_08582 [Teladorsagia circumcincta]
MESVTAPLVRFGRGTIVKESPLLVCRLCVWLHFAQQLMDQLTKTSSIRLQQKTQVSVGLPDYRIESTVFPSSALQGKLVQKASPVRTRVQSRTIFAAQISSNPRTTSQKVFVLWESHYFTPPQAKLSSVRELDDVL